MSLSLCMIVKNEEKNLPQCLQSVRGVVDELIIVDTGSTDRTRDIAQEFQAKIFEFEWCDDFAAARNYALRWVDGDWILVLDADEVLIADIIPNLKQAIRAPELLLITLLREEVGATQSPISSVSRLFRNHDGLSFKRPYHELIDDSAQTVMAQEPHWRIGQLNEVAIRHFGYQPIQIQQQQKSQRAQQMLEKGIAQYPNDAYLYGKLGGLYLDLGQVEKAIECLNQGLSQTALEASVHYELAYHLGLAYTRLHQVQKAEQAYQKAIAQSISDVLKVGAYINLGSLYLDHGAFAPAQTLFSHITQVLPNFAIAHYNLGLAFKSLNQLAEAEQSYRRAIALDADHAPSHQNLGVVLFKLGRIEESRSGFLRAIALYEQNDPDEADRLKIGIQELGLM